MRFVCPHCRTSRLLPDDRVGKSGTRVRCTSCGQASPALSETASGWRPSAVYSLEGLVAAELGTREPAESFTPDAEQEYDDRSESILEELASEEARSARLAERLRRAEAAAGLELRRETPAPVSPRVGWSRSARIWFGLACSLGVIIALLLGYIAWKLGTAPISPKRATQQPPPSRPEVEEPTPTRASSDDAAEAAGEIQQEQQARAAVSIPKRKRRPIGKSALRPVKKPVTAKEPDLLDFDGSGRKHLADAKAESRPPPTDREIYLELRRHLAEFRACNRRQQKIDPSVNGVMTLAFRIRGDGRAVGVSVDKRRFRSSYVFGCLSRFIGQIRFPAFDGPAKRFSFEFKVR